MGGGSYSRDVGSSSSSGSFDSGGTSSIDSKSAMDQRYLDSSMSPLGRTIQSVGNHLLILGLDVTGSNKEFARIVYDKLPMLHGQIIQQGYLPEIEIGLAAVGDANTDDAPLQVADFASGIALDDWIKKMYLEGGGGGQQMETYELWAYYYARKAVMKAVQSFGFLIVDEAPYPSVKSRLILQVIGDDLGGDVSTGVIFKELNRKLNGNLYILQNPYCGQPSESTRQITLEWRNVLREDGGTLIPLKEEKSVIDIILGVIAMKSGTRSLAQYKQDMLNRGQTVSRIENVSSSLTSASKAIVPVTNVGGKLPTITDSAKRGSGSKRI